MILKETQRYSFFTFRFMAPCLEMKIRHLYGCFWTIETRLADHFGPDVVVAHMQGPAGDIPVGSSETGIVLRN